MSRTARRLLVVPATAATLLLAASPAWAHVEVGADPAGPGAKDVTLTFHVPNEEAPARTTSVLVALPADHPLGAVTPVAGDGWTPTVDGTQITWSGGAIAGRDTTDFRVRVATLPSDVDTLTFKVLQGYDNGTTVAWIETAAPGAAEPEHPAPVLDVATGKAMEEAPTAGADDHAAAPSVAAESAPVAPAPETGNGALVGGISAIAGLAALGGLLAWRRRRTATAHTPKIGE